MKNQKGITLIALIITIIVMLILVSVAITASVQSGLFGHAGKAVDEQKKSQENELNIDNTMTTDVNGTTVTGLNDIINAYTNGLD